MRSCSVLSVSWGRLSWFAAFLLSTCTVTIAQPLDGDIRALRRHASSAPAPAPRDLLSGRRLSESMPQAPQRPRRRLPGAKVSTPQQSSVSCVGSWGAYGSCACSGGGCTQTRVYTITRQKSGSGQPCPFSSGAATSRSCTPTVDCAGSWSGYGVCGCSGGSCEQTRTYTITRQASGAGNACPSAAGTAQSQSCTPKVDCVGSWAEWGACSLTCGTGLKSRSYSISTPAQGGGNLCLKASGRVEQSNCDNGPCPVGQQRQVVAIQWEAIGKDLRLVSCPIGAFAEFSWITSSGSPPDLFIMSNEQDYVDCNFKGIASTRVARASEGKFVYPCTEMGTVLFSSSVGNHCSISSLRVHVQVTDPSKTATLRSQLNTLTGKKHTTLAMIMAEDVSEADFAGVATDLQADTALERLWCAEPHAPESCADWIPAYLNTKELCLAWIKTDLGYFMRKKPTANYTGSKHYYEEALKVVPNYCPAESYLTELSIQLENESEAAEGFLKACTACGAKSRDMVSVVKKYTGKGWTLPAGGLCSPTTTTTHSSLDSRTVPASFSNAPETTTNAKTVAPGAAPAQNSEGTPSFATSSASYHFLVVLLLLAKCCRV